MVRVIGLFCIAVFILCFGSTWSRAQEEDTADGSPWSVGGSAGIVTDYVDRGYSQSDEFPAAQGEIYLDHDSGFSGYVWGSTVDFEDGHEASIELDAGLSYTFPVGPGEATLGGIYYVYPGADEDLNYDYAEFLGGYAYSFGDAADVEAQLYYSPDYFAGSGDSLYAVANVTVPISAVEGLSAVGSVGHQWIDDNAQYGAPDYADWSAGLDYLWRENIGFSAKYHDTDVSNGSCWELCGARVVGGISYFWP